MNDTEKMNEAMYERLGEIVKFASNKRVELDPDFKGGRPDDAHNRLMLAAFKDLRQMCEFYKPSEEPIVPGCPSLMPRQLPGGFDGTGPVDRTAAVSAADRTSPAAEDGGGTEALKKRGAKIKVCNDRSRKRMEAISSISSRCLTDTCHLLGYEPGQYGSDYRTFGKAFCEIRKLVKEAIADVAPDYEMLALQFARNSFDFAKFQEALAAVASMKAEDFPGVYYTPGWLCELAKKLEASSTVPSASSPTGADKRKPTMDFGRFHVTRAAIPGTTILTFRRKREHLPEFATVVPGRIIVAKITRKEVGAEKPDHRFIVKSYEAGEKPRVLFAGDSWVSMSKTEKMVYKMVKCDVKETHRRRISRKRKAAAKAAAENGGQA